MNDYFLNVGKERETYAVVAIVHVEDFTTLVITACMQCNSF